MRLFRDRSGTTAMEFGLIAVPICLIFFAIFDLGRYALTIHSLMDIADETARRQIICYSPWIAKNNVAGATCPSDPVTNKTTIAPFLTGMTVSVATTGTGPHVVTASVPGFTMILGFWPAGMNTASVSVSLPF
jgi:Flp pilus assembly protein TadG